jgi:hypothetical protein
MTAGSGKARVDTATGWSTKNPVLAPGEQGYDLTNKILAVGDGVSTWVQLTAVHVIGAAGEPAFQNGWTSMATFGPVGFWKSSVTGLVHFQGIPQNSGDPAGNSVMFTLPVGYRPSATRILEAIANNLSGTFVQINTTGEVLVISNLAASASVYLDGKFFRI